MIRVCRNENRKCYESMDTMNPWETTITLIKKFKANTFLFTYIEPPLQGWNIADTVYLRVVLDIKFQWFKQFWISLKETADWISTYSMLIQVVHMANFFTHHISLKKLN